jgi:hypothetical protein
VNTPGPLRRYLPPGTDLTPQQATLAAAVLAVDRAIELQGAKWGRSFVRALLCRYFADEAGTVDLAALDGGDWRARIADEATGALAVLATVYDNLAALDQAAGRQPRTIAERVLATVEVPHD